MIVNRYSNSGKQFIRKLLGQNKAVTMWHLYKHTKRAQSDIEYMNKNPELMFQKVEIETVNRCNGECAFCPVNKHIDKRPFARMSEELFEKIINQLGELDYKGELALYSNNDPFLDPRIVDFAKIARERVPHAFIHLSTNGKALTVEKAQAILPYIDRMIIDDYNDELTLSPISESLNELSKNDPVMDQKIQIHLRKQHEVLYTRGGQAPNNDKQKTYPIACALPFVQLVIRPTGLVSLCCCDALGKWTMGDCNTQSLMEIWHSKEYAEVREKMIKGRENINICRYCDHFIRPSEYHL